MIYNYLKSIYDEIYKLDDMIWQEIWEDPKMDEMYELDLKDPRGMNVEYYADEQYDNRAPVIYIEYYNGRLDLDNGYTKFEYLRKDLQPLPWLIKMINNKNIDRRFKRKETLCVPCVGNLYGINRVWGGTHGSRELGVELRSKKFDIEYDDVDLFMIPVVYSIRNIYEESLVPKIVMNDHNDMLFTKVTDIELIRECPILGNRNVIILKTDISTLESRYIDDDSDYYQEYVVLFNEFK